MSKPSIPKGTRDFLPVQMVKRNYLFDTLRSIFKKYCYLPIETPAVENLSTLMGKYGEEGDRLIFKILNSGDYLGGVENITQHTSGSLTKHISEKALRYDLTVPFARFVVQNQNELSFPFKRFQIQPVWRADRPQKGRYREFFQCDVDVVGSDSLMYEIEFVQIFSEALTALKVPGFQIKINNRKILSGIAEVVGAADKIVDITVAIDKLDKIGLEKVNEEMLEKGVSKEAVEKLQPIIQMSGSAAEKFATLRSVLSSSEIGLKGIEENYELPQGAEDDVWSLTDAERRALGITPLPTSLDEAIKVMEKSELVAETLGEHVFDYFQNKIDVILDGGNCPNGIESTIIGFEGEQPVLYRFGAIPIEEIEKIVGPIKVHNKDSIAPSAPGMFTRHYAPSTKSFLVWR